VGRGSIFPMCNHYRLDDPKAAELARLWATTAEERGWVPQNEAWPKAEMPVVFQAKERTLAVMRWGVWPFFEKAMPARPIANARDDGLLTKATWKRAAARGRCLVPANGFYEWCGPAGGKWEVLFELEGERPFFFAGVWSRDPAGEGRGFALVTGRPNELVAALPHDRMPVILDDEGARAWIGDQPLEPEKLLGLCAPYPAARMTRTDQPKPARAGGRIETERVEPGELFFGGFL